MVRLALLIGGRSFYLTILARSTEPPPEAGAVQFSPLHGRSPLLLHEEVLVLVPVPLTPDEVVAVTAASLMDARLDSSWHSHLHSSG